MSELAAYSVTRLNGDFSGLGYTTHKRKINKSSEYDKYWNLNSVKGNETEIIRMGQMINGLTTEATQLEMNKIVVETLPQTIKIAQKLKGASTESTLKNIANYFKNYYQFQIDRGQKEQLREPVRAYKDRIEGIDCDCFSISVSSILHNLGIDHYWRKSKPQSQGDYAHIYVVVPKFKGADLSVRANYWVIDPVVGDFDKEHTANRPPRYRDDYHVKTIMGEGMGFVSFNLLPANINTKKVAIITGVSLLAITGIVLAVTHKRKSKSND